MFAEVTTITQSFGGFTKEIMTISNINTHSVENGVLELWNETKKVASFADRMWVLVELKEETENG